MQKRAVLRAPTCNICIFCQHRRSITTQTRAIASTSTSSRNDTLSRNTQVPRWRTPRSIRQLRRIEGSSLTTPLQMRCFGGFALSTEERKNPLAARTQRQSPSKTSQTKEQSGQDPSPNADQHEARWSSSAPKQPRGYIFRTTKVPDRPSPASSRFALNTGTIEQDNPFALDEQKPRNGVRRLADTLQAARSRATPNIRVEERGNLFTSDEKKKEPAPANWQGLRKKPSPDDVAKLLQSASRPRRVNVDLDLDDLMKDGGTPRPSYTPFIRRINFNQKSKAYVTPHGREDSEPHRTNKPDNQSMRDPDKPLVSFRPATNSWSKDGPGDHPRGLTKDDKVEQTADELQAVEKESYRHRRQRRLEEARGTELEEAWAKDPRNKQRRGRRSAQDEDDFDDARALREERKRAKQNKKAAKKEAPKPISLPEYISVLNLATALRIPVDGLVSKMEELGFENVENDHILASEDASLIAMEYNYQPLVEDEASRDLLPQPVPEHSSDLPARPPIVTIMGHVDHGKTTLLDYLRKSAVVESEFGGITQHIGAFSVPLPSGKTITFLDTPGHAAFLNMRQRGANVTDIVVLVVAADDSVKPQTIEAIRHAQGARVPIIVAMNKIDKQGADLETVKKDLMGNGVEVEDYGGDVQAIPVSGKTGQGMEDLEEAIVTLSEMLDHRADPEGQVEGWVIEASTKISGKVATVLVRRGTLRSGDVLVAGTTWTKVRSLKTDAGAIVDSAGPGIPVEVDGWREQPEAGDEIIQAQDEHKATSVVSYREEKAERVKLAVDMDAINEARRIETAKRAAEEEAARRAEEDPDGNDVEAEDVPDKPVGPINVPFIVKADVSGSAEAIVDSIVAIANGEVQVQVLRSGVGPVSEFDIEHARVASGYIINFNTQTPGHINALADASKVKILEHNIIYRLVDDVKNVVSEKLAPKITQRVVGEAEILQTFNFNVRARKFILIAGVRVRTGMLKNGGRIRLLRNQETVHDGTISSLKNHKKDVEEMSRGSECGVVLKDFEDFMPGDIIQHYEEVSEKRHI